MTIEDLFIGTENESLLNYISFASVEDYKQEEYFYNCPPTVIIHIIDRFKINTYKQLKDTAADPVDEESWA